MKCTHNAFDIAWKISFKIIDAGLRLRLSPRACSTAVVYMQRCLSQAGSSWTWEGQQSFVRQTLHGTKNTEEEHTLGSLFSGTEVEYNDIQLVATFLFLASKVCEEPRRIRDCMLVSFQVWDHEPLRLDGKYVQMKRKVVQCEQVVLRALRFDLDCPTSEFTFLRFFQFARHLQSDGLTLRLGFAMLTDSFRLPMAGTVDPATLAAAAIYVATKIERQSKAGISQSVRTPTLAQFERSLYCREGLRELEKAVDAVLAVQQLHWSAPQSAKVT